MPSFFYIRIVPIPINIILLLSFIGISARCQELTVYVLPPNGPLSWHSPQSLLTSFGANLIRKKKHPPHSHPLGHLIVELKNRDHYMIGGMIAKSRSELNKKVLFGGYGLGIFFARIGGVLKEGQVNIDEITGRYRTGDVAFIKFKLNEATFVRLWQYLDEYKSRGYDKIYNGNNKPRDGTGSGCSAFGISFIEVGGLLPADTISKWAMKLNMPEKLIGGPGGDGRRVGFFSVLMKRKWADTARQQYRVVTSYDPQLIFRWISDVWGRAGRDVKHKYEIETRGAAKGVVYDRTQWRVPDDPIWTGQIAEK
jgi:hypothetical protein